MITNQVLTHLYDNQTPVALLDGKSGEVLSEMALIVGISGNEFDIEDADDPTRYFVLSAGDARYCPEPGRVYFENYIRRI